MALKVKYPLIVIALIILMVTGCSSRGVNKQAEGSAWKLSDESGDGGAGSLGIRELSSPETPRIVSDADFAGELATLFSNASSEIAKLSTEAGIATEFPTDASRLLGESARVLQAIADEGYRSFEEELIEAYGEFVESTSDIQDGIDLGESRTELTEKDDEQKKNEQKENVFSSDILTLKQANWSEELKRLKGELAAERSRFAFMRESLLISYSVGIAADQEERIAALEDQLQDLGDDYALRVSSAIDESIAGSSIGIVYRSLSDVNYDEQVGKFKNDFEAEYKKVEVITGETD